MGFVRFDFDLKSGLVVLRINVYEVDRVDAFSTLIKGLEKLTRFYLEAGAAREAKKGEMPGDAVLGFDGEKVVVNNDALKRFIEIAEKLERAKAKASSIVEQIESAISDLKEHDYRAHSILASAFMAMVNRMVEHESGGLIEAILGDEIRERYSPY
ncbi:MAG: hypothetical protein ABGW50_02020 [Thermococcus sp.]